MDDNDLADVNLMDLDLNQEPMDPPLHRVAAHGLLSELETAHGRIEERIRQLEAVTARARQRQRWRQSRNSMEIYNVPGELIVNSGDHGNNSSGVMERTAERGKGCKRDSSHLVAKALEMDSEVKKADKEGGSFYDCNICLDVATEPVLTCCGHLFCWPCFYQVSDIDSTSKECPVCKGEVSESTVIPIYGNGDSEPVLETESGLKIPPRPKACRIESVRQQRVSQGLSHVPVAETLRRIRISIGAMGQQAPQQEGSSSILNFDTSHEGQNSEVAGGHRLRIHQVSRVLSESAASLSSLSSALSNAERLVEDLETVINSRLLRNASRVVPVDIRPSVVIQPNNQPLESTAGINTSLPFPLPITSTSLAPDITGSTFLRTRTSRATNLTLPPIRRRSIVSRIPDLDNQDGREPRRRRLN